MAVSGQARRGIDRGDLLPRNDLVRGGRQRRIAVASASVSWGLGWDEVDHREAARPSWWFGVRRFLLFRDVVLRPRVRCISTVWRSARCRFVDTGTDGDATGRRQQ